MDSPRQSILGSLNGLQSYGLKYSNKLPKIASFIPHLFLCRKKEGRKGGEKERRESSFFQTISGMEEDVSKHSKLQTTMPIRGVAFLVMLTGNFFFIYVGRCVLEEKSGLYLFSDDSSWLIIPHSNTKWDAGKM